MFRQYQDIVVVYKHRLFSFYGLYGVIISQISEKFNVKLQPQTDFTKPQLDLNDLYRKVLSLREQDRQEAEDKLQVALLLATTEKMCRTLTDFMTATESELRKMNDNQLNTLNVQEQYRKEIKGEVVNALDEIFGYIQNKQTNSFNEMMLSMQSAADKLEEKITACTDKCRTQTVNVKNAVEKMRKVESWQDMLLWISPIAVLLDLVVRLIQYFGLA